VKIEDAKEELADLEVPEWYVLDRQYIATFADYGQNADRIGAIGEVFPVIFFLVAALVCLTTMTRMVEEQRTQIGTLKALGYGKGAIASKYLMYALLSSVLGSLFGLVVGQKLLPSVIISAYRILYTNLPDILTPLNFWYSLTAMAAAVFCTTAATWAACYKGLNAVPAQLMRPVAPKAGKRVLLERLTFLWKRLNFSQKATVRNLIRYKKRFFMTIFGIGGCMALLLVGFGLKDSIMYIGTGQFENVFSYDAAIGIDSDSTPEEREELLVKAEQDERILCSMEVLQTAIDIEKDGVEKSAYLVVPQVPEELDSYIHLQDRVTQEAYSLDSDGIILNEKLASVLGIDEGDTVILKEDETSRVEAVVSHITENYFMHYIYMSPELYEELFGKEPEWNVLFTDNVQNDNAFEAAMQEEYMELDAVSGLSFISGTAERVADMLRSMDLIIYVLVIAAGLLAFVVLYNLNNININERKRELATLKVLGFYDGEVSAYVNRENVLLTVLGAAAGVILGIFLHRFVIVTAETDTLMFGRTITAKSYLYSVILTFLFSAAVNGVMFFKLRRIDMVESLKSVE
jgi:putative ABC transport system permease protein